MAVVFSVRTLVRGALLLLAPIVTACASSQVAVSGPAMGIGAAVAPPAAYMDYCARQPSECGVDPTRADAGQTVSRRYWKAVFAASASSTHRGGVDWAGVADTIDEAPASVSRASLSPVDSAGRPLAPQRAELFAALADAPGSATDEDAGARIRHAPWGADTRALVARINAKVNSAIHEQTDMVTYGMEDYWAIPTLQGKDVFGDCEDYALMKRRDLVAAGLPMEALSIAIVVTPARTLHAVLLVSTDQGDFVLDNLDGAVRAWTDTPYVWVKRQAPGSGFAWVRPQGPVQPIAARRVRATVAAAPAPVTPTQVAMQVAPALIELPEDI